MVNAVSALPVQGVSVTTRINNGSAAAKCTATTNAQGVATCTAGPIIVFAGAAFAASAAEGVNTQAGTGTGTVRLFSKVRAF